VSASDLPSVLTRVIVALIPLSLGALATIAWQNSHQLARNMHDLETLRVDLERTRAALEPGRTIQLRLDANEKELAHLRGLIEDRLSAPPPGRATP
jgi:hypothetical protein